jgi:hypothetical protein
MRGLGQLPNLEFQLFGGRDPRLNVDQLAIPDALARASATFDARVPECLSVCEGLSTSPPLAGEKSEKERCFDLCQSGTVADPVTAGRNQARCAAIVHDPANAPLFAGDGEIAWTSCVGDPELFLSQLQQSGLPVADVPGAKPWYKKPSTWIIAGAALAAGAVVLYA